jgi:hypothetical protein
VKRSALVNLLIGFTIAILPLYTRVTIYDFNRTSKDNLLVILFGVFSFLLTSKQRRMPRSLWVALVYALIILILNQSMVASLNVIFQTFYISMGILFFVKYYENYDRDSLKYIFNGASIGCLIQCLIITFDLLGYPIYEQFVMLFSGDFKVTGIEVQAIGSFGNRDMVASYLSLTGITLFRRRWVHLLPLVIVPLIATKSIMGIASFSMGAIYLFNSNKNFFKKIYIYAAIVAGMITLPFLNLGHDSARFQAWGRMLSLVDPKHFLIGKGPGWFPGLQMTLHPGFVEGNTVLLQEHNEFLSAFNIFGIIGIALIIPSFIKFLKSSDKNKIMSAILITGFCNSYGHFTFHQSTTALIIIIASCVCLGESNGNLDG